MHDQRFFRRELIFEIGSDSPVATLALPRLLGIFGVIDLKLAASPLASERLDIVRRMAAAMCYERSYVADIVSCPALAACAVAVPAFARATAGDYVGLPAK